MNVKRFVLVVASILLLAVYVRADNVDWSCGLKNLGACTGTVTQSGNNYSSTGISVFDGGIPYTDVPFTLTFDTSTDTIGIYGAGVYDSQELEGTITDFYTTFVGSVTDLHVAVYWSDLPADVQAVLHSTTGITDPGFIISRDVSGQVRDVDLLIQPVPEPATLIFLGTGLLGLGGLLRRRFW